MPPAEWISATSAVPRYGPPVARSDVLCAGLQALVEPGEAVSAAVVLSNGYIKHQVLHVLGLTDRALLLAPVRHRLRWKVLEPVERLQRLPIDPLPVASGTGWQPLVVDGRRFYVDRVGCSEAAALNAAIAASSGSCGLG